jgi:hypothetical protein
MSTPERTDLLRYATFRLRGKRNAEKKQEFKESQSSGTV